MALAPLGLAVVMQPTETMAGFGGADGKPWFWVNGRARRRTAARRSTASTSPSRRSTTTRSTPTTHAAGLAAGGTDNGGPGPRPIYHPTYYGAFVLDPDGNNVEAVCHGAEG